MSEVTRILDRVQQGDPKATDELMPLIYEELRRLAAVKMSGRSIPPLQRKDCSSALLRGRLDGFSSDRLFRFLKALDRDIEVVIKPVEIPKHPGTIRVLAIS